MQIFIWSRFKSTLILSLKSTLIRSYDVEQLFGFLNPNSHYSWLQKFETGPLKKMILWSPGLSYTASILSRLAGRPLQKRWIWVGLKDTRCLSRVRRQKYFPEKETHKFSPLCHYPDFWTNKAFFSRVCSSRINHHFTFQLKCQCSVIRYYEDEVYFYRSAFKYPD